MQPALAVSLLVHTIAVLMLAMGIAEFVSLVRGCFVLRRIARTGRQEYGQILLKSPMVPAVSTIATPTDASADSLKFVRRLLDLHFGRNEVVIVLDGPSEAELEIWARELRLVPSGRVVPQRLKTLPVISVYESRDPVRVVVVNKEHGGPVDAWNAGLNAATSPVIGILDPESEFIPEVLLRLIHPMLEGGDETIAVCGGVSAPPADGSAAQFGSLEALRAWMTRGAAYANHNLTLPFPGCAILVRRKAILDAGGFTGGPLELFVRLHGLARVAGKPYRIAFQPERLSHARTPHSYAELRAQINREQHEISRALRNRVAIAGPFGWQTLRGLYYVRSLRPKLELLAYALAIFGMVMNWIDIFTFLLVLLATSGMGIVVSMAAVVLREVAEPVSPDERRMARMFFAAISENLVYRFRRNFWLIAGYHLSRDKKVNRERAHESAPPAVSTTSAVH